MDNGSESVQGEVLDRNVQPLEEQPQVLDCADLALLLAALSDPCRLKIVRCLRTQRKARVKRLMVAGAGFKTIREHIKILLQANLIIRTVTTEAVEYSLSHEALNTALFTLQEYFRSDSENLVK
jgi:hypothetical protein